MIALKELRDILKQDRDGWAWVGSHAKQTYKTLSSAGSITGTFLRKIRPPSRFEQLDRLREICNELDQPDFPRAFSSRQTYPEFLLTLIVAAVDISERGFIIGDLCLPGAIFYFPRSKRNKVLYTRSSDREKKIGFEIEQTRFSNYFYHFFAVYDLEKSSLSELRMLLETIVNRSIQEEEEAFIKALGERSLKSERVYTLFYREQEGIQYFSKDEYGFNPSRELTLDRSQDNNVTVLGDIRRSLSPFAGAKREYDVAISYAGEDEAAAKRLSEFLESAGFRVFNYKNEDIQAEFWGKDLGPMLRQIYRDKARYCVVLWSKHYLKRWTIEELNRALQRSLSEDDVYLLPIRLDDTEISERLKNMLHLDIRQMSLERIGEKLLKKIR